MAVNRSLELGREEQIRVIGKGQMTIPKNVRDYYQIEPGHKGTLIPINGAFLIVPSRPKTVDTFDEIRDGLGTQDMSLGEMLAELRKIRDTTEA